MIHNDEASLFDIICLFSKKLYEQMHKEKCAG